MTDQTQIVYTADGTPVEAAPLTDADGNPILSLTGQPILAPVGFSLVAFAQAVGDNIINYYNFKTGGEYDLQRSDMGVLYSSAGISESFVSAFTALASYALGYAASYNGIPLIDVEMGGGLNNLYQSGTNPNINTSGFFWNNPANVPNIEAGYAAAGGAFQLGNFDWSNFPPGLCFAAGTSIDMADGSTRGIEAIAIGDLVLAFDPRDPRGALRSARVTRLFRNITGEWLVLDNGLTVTPGHRFLNERGSFERIDAILARGGKIIGADGVAQSVSAERIIYSQQTRPFYEEAEELVAAASGALALAPQIARGWRTYNFEVEGLHTYVAGGPGSVPILSFEDGTTLNVADVEQQILAQETFATSGDVIGFVDGANAGRAFNLIEQGAQDERLGDALCAENDNCIDEMMAA